MEPWPIIDIYGWVALMELLTLSSITSTTLPYITLHYIDTPVFALLVGANMRQPYC